MTPHHSTQDSEKRFTRSEEGKWTKDTMTIVFWEGTVRSIVPRFDI